MYIPSSHSGFGNCRPSWISIRYAKTQSSSCYKERWYREWLESGLRHQIGGFKLGPLPLSSCATLGELRNYLCLRLFICNMGLIIVLAEGIKGINTWNTFSTVPGA